MQIKHRIGRVFTVRDQGWDSGETEDISAGKIVINAEIILLCCAVA
jgi:hypothetical protein